MDGSQFDTLLRGLSTARSRRGAVMGLLGGAVSLLGLTKSKAKHKKKHHHKKGKGSPPASPPTAPPPPGPTATADASCVSPNAPLNGASGIARQAQTFRALRSGQLTSATIYLFRVGADGTDLDVEIWSVDQANAPSAVLAGTTVSNLSAFDSMFDPRPLTVTFAGPATVSLGLRYALVITGSITDYGLQAYTNDPCPDGNVFQAATVNSAFTSVPELDLRFETVVTA